MLKELIYDIPSISLLNSDKILFTILDNLYSYDLNNKKERLSQSVQDAISDFHLNKYSKPYVEYGFQDIKKYIKDDHIDYGFLDRLYDDFFDISGSKLHIKSENLEIVNSTIRHLHPFNICGYKLACWLKNDETFLENIKEYGKYITHLGYNSNLDEEFTELHMHIGGASETGYMLLDLLVNEDIETELNELPRINRYRYVYSEKLELATLQKIYKTAHYAINKYIINENKKEKELIAYIEDISKIFNGNNYIKTNRFSFNDIEQMEKIAPVQKDTITHKLLCLILEYYKKKKFYKSFFIYNILLHYLHQTTKDQNLKILINIIFLASNIFRSFMNMSQNVGLSNFKDFYSSKYREKVNRDINNTLDITYLSGTTNLEMKTSAPKANEINNFEKKLLYIKLQADKLKDNKQSYQFSIHFNRKKDEKDHNKTDQQYKKFRFKNLREELKQSALELNDFLNSSSVDLSILKTRYNFSVGINDLKAFYLNKNEKINLADHIRSIDIAGDERLTPPEVYAPAINHIRETPKIISKSESMKKPIRISVHAGEDFDFILSGMRRIDESIEFYNMKKFDRLGHALALGIEPKNWFDKNHKEIYIKQGDYLDNLVWISHLIESLNIYGFSTAEILQKYKTKIKYYSKKIYGGIIDDYVLYKAWKLRKFCPIESERAQDTNYRRTNNFLKNYIVPNEEDIDSEEYKLFIRYNNDKTIKSLYDKTIKISHHEKFQNRYDEIITKKEIKLFKIIQDHLIQKISNKGIIIETNPSSNIYIAQLDDYSEHPIFRWYPIASKYLKKGKKYNKYGIRNGRLKVTINTDDPAIFNTTLPNEYEMLRRTAIDMGYCEIEVNNWLKTISKISKESYIN